MKFARRHHGFSDSTTTTGERPPYSIGFVLLPEFSMITFAAALEPLRTANRICGKTLYEWVLISPEGESVRASNGIEIATRYTIDTMPARSMVLLVGSRGSEYYRSSKVMAWLRRMARIDTILGAVGAAPYALARAGLLHNRRCTLHWERAELFADEFPDAVITQDLFVSDGRILTCAGGMAPFDMMLWLIAGQRGEELARAVSDTCICPTIRDGSAQQRMDTAARLGVTNRHVIELVEAMERNIEHPLSLGELGRIVGLSSRHVGRLFRDYLGEGPHQYYLRLRLEKASILLSQSDQSILEIALACGFSSSSHFSQSFVTCFGLTPSAARLRDRAGTSRPIAAPASEPQPIPLLQ